MLLTHALALSASQYVLLLLCTYVRVNNQQQYTRPRTMSYQVPGMTIQKGYMYERILRKLFQNPRHQLLVPYEYMSRISFDSVHVVIPTSSSVQRSAIPRRHNPVGLLLFRVTPQTVSSDGFPYLPALFHSPLAIT